MLNSMVLISFIKFGMGLLKFSLEEKKTTTRKTKTKRKQKKKKKKSEKKSGSSLALSKKTKSILPISKKLLAFFKN